MITDEQYGALIPEQKALFFPPLTRTVTTKSPPVAQRGKGPTHKKTGGTPDWEASKSSAGVWQ